MKFSKELNKNIQQYKNIIQKEYWFNYKLFKKKLKSIILKHYLLLNQRNLINITYLNTCNVTLTNHDDVSEIDECCICLESNNLMKTFCCHNYIHHHCLVHTFTYSNIYCPLCRAPLQDSIKFNPANTEESLDSEILSLISSVHLELIKIHYLCNNQLRTLKPTISKTYYNINMTAVIKISKKIDKHVHTRIKPYFSNIIEKNKATLTFDDNKRFFCTIV
jgi:hypothetical protein